MSVYSRIQLCVGYGPKPKVEARPIPDLPGTVVLTVRVRDGSQDADITLSGPHADVAALVREMMEALVIQPSPEVRPTLRDAGRIP